MKSRKSIFKSLIFSVLALVSNLSYAQTGFFNDLIFIDYIDYNSGTAYASRLYNPTCDSIDLGAGGYRYVQFNQGGATITSPSSQVALTGVVPPGGTFIISSDSYNGTMFFTVCGDADLAGQSGVNGNDIVGLIKGGAFTTIAGSNWVDMIGLPGYNSGGTGQSQTVGGVTDGLAYTYIVRTLNQCNRFDEVDGSFVDTDKNTSWPNNDTLNVTGWDVVKLSGVSDPNRCLDTMPIPDYLAAYSNCNPDSATICPGDTLLWGSLTITDTGTYVDSFAATTTCDSFARLVVTSGGSTSFTVNDSICSGDTFTTAGGQIITMPGTYTDTVTGSGCDSFITYNIDTYLTTYDTIEAYLCAGEDTVFNFFIFNVTDTIDQNLTSYTGCDSILTIYLYVLDSLTDTINQTICPGDTFSANGQDYTMAGTYQQSLSGTNGCDSFLTIVLDTFETRRDTIEAEICPTGDTTINAQLFNSPGDFQQTLTSSDGCDSFLTVRIDTYATQYDSIEAFICPGSDTTINGFTYSTVGAFIQTRTDIRGCDSVVTINIDTLSATFDTIQAGICPGEDTTINGTFYNSAGNFDQTITNVQGCDSNIHVQISFLPTPEDTIQASFCSGGDTTINGFLYNSAGTFSQTLTASNTCDSTLYIEITLLPAASDTIEASFCSGDDTTINAVTYNTAGTFTQNLTAANGCDSTLTIITTVLNSTFGSFADTICNGDSAIVNASIYTAAGSYFQTLVNANGCDSFLTVDIVVLPTASETIGASFCPGGDTTINAVLYDSAGSYTQTLTAFNGCDSTLTINISLLPETADSISASICPGDTVRFNGTDYTNAGTFIQNLTNSAGCDSTLTIFVSLLNEPVDTIQASICAGSDTTINAITYSSAGSFNQTLTASNGCDSTLTVEISVRPVPSESITANICAGDDTTINGTLYNSAGAFSDTLLASNGCDSLLTVNIVILPLSSDSIFVDLCSGEDSTINAITYNSAGTFSQTLSGSNGCDSTLSVIVNILPLQFDTLTFDLCERDTLTVNSLTITSDGVYEDTLVSSNGCDSFLTIFVNPLPAASGNYSELICPGLGTSVNGTFYPDPGIFYDTLSNAAFNGCDSILEIDLGLVDTLPDTIRVFLCSPNTYITGNGDTLNASGVDYDTFTRVVPCDSIVVTLLTIDTLIRGFETQEICYDDSVFFNGSFRNVSGTYFDTLTALAGCDSIAEFTLIVADTVVFDTIQAVICAGNDTTINAVTYNTAGTYSQNLIRGNGCDSTLVIELSVQAAAFDTIQASICDGSDTTINAVTYNTSGSFNQVLTSSNGCDSTLTVEITVLPNSADTIQAVICNGLDTIINGDTFSASGTSIQNLTSFNGCDSTLTVEVTVLPTPVDTIQASFCAGDDTTINAQLFNTAGSFNQTLTASNGCDSTLTVEITVIQPTADTITARICDGSDTTINTITYNTAGFYTTSLTNAAGCDSSLTIEIIVLPNTSDTITAVICSNADTVINGDTFSAFGTYVQNLQNADGCDSTLTIEIDTLESYSDTIFASFCTDTTINGITYNSAGTFVQSYVSGNGCDSNLVIVASPLANLSDTVTADFCAGDDTTVNGVLYNSAGIFTQNFTAFNGCDSTLYVIITTRSPSLEVLNLSKCANDTAFVNDTAYVAGGSYVQTLTNAAGCDSTLLINITDIATTNGNISVSLCRGSDTTINGTTYDSSGVYNQTLTNANSCDSFLTINITVNDTFFFVDNVTPFCAGQTVTIAGTTYDTSGTFFDTFASENGCDSIMQRNITVRDTFRIPIADTICIGDSFDFLGTMLGSPGFYQDTLISSLGCDSFIDLTLVVLDSSSETISDTLCLGQTTAYNGKAFDTTGIYRDTLAAFNGCDSFLYYNLLFGDTFYIPFNTSLCRGESFNFNGNSYTLAGQYIDTLNTALGCDSIFEINISLLDTSVRVLFDTISSGDTFDFNGQQLTLDSVYFDTLAKANGCDSIIILDLFVNLFTLDTITLEVCDATDTVIAGDSLTTAGFYIVDTATSQTGFDDSVVVIEFIKLPPEQVVPIADTTYVCLGDLPFLLPNGTPVNTGGTYFDTALQNYLGCDSIINTIELRILQTDTISLGTVEICEGSSVDTFGFEDLFVAGDYFWPDTFDYSVLGGCDSVIYFFTLITNPTPDSIVTLDSVFCEMLPFNTTITTADFGDLDFTIEFPGQDQYGTDPPQFVNDASGCPRELLLELTAHQMPDVFIDLPSIDPVVTIFGDTNMLMGANGSPFGGAYEYRWITPNQVVTDGQFNNFFVSGSSDYIVEMYYPGLDDRCVARDTIALEIGQPVQSFLQPYVVPEAFTPNGDGINDRLAVYGLPGLELDVFQVFDRWGRIVYEGDQSSAFTEVPGESPLPTNSDNGWDGKFALKDQPMGAYIFVAKMRWRGEDIVITGSINLFR